MQYWSSHQSFLRFWNPKSSADTRKKSSLQVWQLGMHGDQFSSSTVAFSTMKQAKSWSWWKGSLLEIPQYQEQGRVRVRVRVRKMMLMPGFQLTWMQMTTIYQVRQCFRLWRNKTNRAGYPGHCLVLFKNVDLFSKFLDLNQNLHLQTFLSH